MKTKLFFLVSAILSGLGSFQANVITVSNNAIAAGMYSSIQLGCDNANVGDTVYVMGSPTTYGDVTIKKQLTLIGAGYNVSQTQNNWNTTIGYCYLDTIPFGTKISGTRIMGFNMYSLSQNGATGLADSIKWIDIERNYINNYVNIVGSNWTIRNNIINYININNNSNVFIQNNFLNYNINTSNQTSVVISNNDFVTSSSAAFNSLSNALIANNVFYYSSPTTGTINCTFSNNITTAGSVQVLPPSGNSGSGNLNNVSPQFMDAATIPNGTVNTNQIWNYNWSLKTTSPAHNAGTDLKDLGVYGGSYPMPNLSGATRIPQMQFMNVGGIVPQGGNLNVNFKARKTN
jgi:hypothetical protein